MIKYVLTQQVPRAETTDTSIIAVADNRGDLEEMILSIYEEAKEAHNKPLYLQWFIEKFQIHEVMYIKG